MNAKLEIGVSRSPFNPHARRREVVEKRRNAEIRGGKRDEIHPEDEMAGFDTNQVSRRLEEALKKLWTMPTGQNGNSKPFRR